MKNETTKVLYDAGNTILTLGLIFYKTLVLMLVWNWFVPSIFGFTSLTYSMSFGLILVIAVIRQKTPTVVEAKQSAEMDREEKQGFELANKAFAVAGLSVLLLLSFIIQAFVG